MAQVHHAYTLDQPQYLNVIDALWHEDLQKRHSALFDAANETYSNFSAHPALNDIRCDGSWLVRDEDCPQVGEWLLIMLAPHLDSAPSLSSRVTLGFEILKLWGKYSPRLREIADLLVHGGPIKSLYNQSIWVKEVSELRYMEQYCGWLPMEKCAEIDLVLASINTDQEMGGVLKRLESETAPKQDYSYAQVMMALSDAMEMIQSAVQKRGGLVIAYED